MATAKKDTVKVKFPTFEELIKMPEFDGVEPSPRPEDICVKLSDEDLGVYFGFTADCLGSEITFDKTDDGGYTDNKFLNFDADEAQLLHKVVKIISGKPVDPPIDIDGDFLTYDKKSKTFECGCKTIDHKTADQVFRFIGGILGYTIT